MSKLLKVLGVLALIVGIIWFIVVISRTGEFWSSAVILFSFIPGFALFYGVGQLLENTEEIMINLKNNNYGQDKPYYSKTQYKQCPECGELNSMHAGGCVSCSASLMSAKIVEK